ncbi:MAG TPA: DUF1549 and DUF1553 domain-containing protein [Bryobacteraceae bacterium]|nr:DUF1549 and DUF1553 domain-containing protein [Bryobacteraceae bacterium]
MLGKQAVIALMASVGLWAASVAPSEHYTPSERKHWSFQKRAHPDVPRFTSGRDRAWVKNPIDAFVLERLNQEGLKPAREADRTTLIRRVYFDLTGLPPTPAEIEAFVDDKSADAYEELVDRLLASPHYGERWGQHWLDVARFAESDGYEYDTHRPAAWRYRDYVIQSFNDDKPYDKFVVEQLAGDEIAPQDHEMRIAAGFARLGPLRKNAGNQAVAFSRNEMLTEMTNTVGAAMLGVTLGCARCHDHKFDPIRQKDYYRMQAYFAAISDTDLPIASPEQQAEWKTKTEAAQAAIAALKTKMKEPGLDSGQRAAMEKQLEELKDSLPVLPALYSVADDFDKLAPIHVLPRGDGTHPGEEVGPRPLGVLLPDGAPELPEDARMPRLQLAKWIVDPENPLTARVMVNRIWLGHFGRGIVATPNDFGRMGARPTHPELLDWLANQLVDGGWKMKPLHRLILLSSTYRQTSLPTDAAGVKEKDPDNKYLSHFNRRRLEAEEVRDAMLAVSGKLNLKAGGPSVIVPVDPALVQGLYKPAQWAVTKDASEYDRRSIYLFQKRNFHLPFMEVFDAPDEQISCPRRESSTDAPQALELLNGELSNRLADAFAQRLSDDARDDRMKEIRLAYRLAAGRAPNADEEKIAFEFLRTQPLREFALAMFNLNAFLYVD